MKAPGLVFLVTAAFVASAQTGALVDRVGSTGFIQLRAESFRTLDAKQKELAYWLTQASIALDPIAYDQFSSFGIREKRLLEEIESPSGGNRSRGVQEDHGFRETVLGQSRQSS